jgi:NitT/TauT family transport system ATP-binding protein
MTGIPFIKLDRVSKKFGKTVLAVDNISLNIQEGEFITFLGPSGCGKSTALKMIAGLLPGSAGTIDITPPSSESPSRIWALSSRGRP